MFVAVAVAVAAVAVAVLLLLLLLLLILLLLLLLLLLRLLLLLVRCLLVLIILLVASDSAVSTELVLNFCTRSMVLCRFSAWATWALRKTSSCISHRYVEHFRHDLHGYERIFGGTSHVS